MEQSTAPEGGLTTEEAANLLGVKPATLYAYVSRGLLARRRGLDGRSRFAAEDVERLRQRGRPTAATRGQHITIESAITTVEDDAIYLRGRDVLEVASSLRFEEAAEWLWTGHEGAVQPWRTDPGAARTGEAVQAALPADVLPLDRLRVTAAAIAPTDPMRYDTGEEAVRVTGRRLISALVDTLPPLGEEPVEAGLSARLWSRLGPSPATPDLIRLLDSALVLLLDHELSISTLSARMAASVLADPYSVVSVGLSALGGPLHAVNSLAAEDLLAEVSEPERATWTIGERLRRGDRLPGFGHQLHPSGDPRASFLLGRLRSTVGSQETLAVVGAILDATTERGLPAANIDFALAALSRTCGMLRGASEAIFGLARAAGWIAHALEVYAGDLDMRPQVIYVGAPVVPER
ncbi:MAG TPA: citrate synthase [Candidatus Dormibacteraeota bacterium]|jgi:citrate synthase|nr:citrate synthase [Candidatus Dormibacteraeota bacterium]